jgi:methionine-S-sulfoxide reductase
MTENTSQSIILGGGCFWCIEAAFLSLPGIIRAKSGYAGGHDDDPNYKQVCTGSTGHAEVVLVEWDKQITNLETVLDAFFVVHDPTSLNRQGNDIGTQYRSFIGYSNEEQLAIIESFIKQQQACFEQPIVTELQQAPQFYPAEIEHEDYYRQNSSQPYCQMVIRPKLDKLAKAIK